MTAEVGPQVLSLITAGLTEVKEAVNALSRDLHSTLARLPNEYVPRRELERRLDDLIIDLGAERAARQTAILALEAASAKAEDDRIQGRRWLISLSLGTVITALGVLSGVVLHFS